jgi:ATP-dependent DNA helicase PIF1
MSNHAYTQGHHKPFGGKTVVLGGDFRQILPVVTKGKREHIVSATLHKSALWDQCNLYTLHQNMRLQSMTSDPALCSRMSEFAQWVLSIGDGCAEGITFDNLSDSTWIKIPDTMLINEMLGLQGLIDATYPALGSSYADVTYLRGRAILAPTNKDVETVNAHMIRFLPGQERTYFSSDSKFNAANSEGINGVVCSPEFLNSLVCSSLPNHKFTLKLGTPIILLRNLNQNIGLCNGTRLTVTKLGDKALQACILTGTESGRLVTIPRIKLFSDKGEFPFILQRIQFPIRIAFAMTINKSQGQTLEKVGIYLWNPVFCHGQLYVAVSRATSPDGLAFLIRQQPGLPPGYTYNIVYKEVLQAVLEKSVCL